MILAHGYRRFAATALLLLAVVRLHAEQPASAPVTTLPLEQMTPVNLTTEQREADRTAARRRAEIAASLPGAAERELIVPEILLIQREALNDLPVASSHPAGPSQTWRLRSSSPPELFAQRVIARLMRAGFSTAPSCQGEEWSGTHGKSRVAVRAEERVVAVQLVLASVPCPAGVKP